MSDKSLQNNRVIDKIAIFFVAIINTAPNLVLNYAAQNVLVHYNYEFYYLIFFWTSTLIVLVSRFLNNLFVSLNFRYDIVILTNIILLLLGLAICSFYFNFFTALICIVIVNFATSFLDSAILCYITARRKQELLKFWGCGLGFTGLINAGYSFLCAKYDVSMFWTIIAFIFLPVIYVILFFAIIHRSKKSELPRSATKQEDEENASNTDSNAITEPMLNAQSENPYENPNQPKANDDPSVSQVEDDKKEIKIGVCNMAFFHKSWGLILNFSFVYFLYRLIRGIIDLYGLKHEMTTVYTVPFLDLCFYIGFFLSICSIFIVSIKKIWIFTIIQILIFSISCIQAIIHFTKTLIFYPFLFIFGICCGFSYINAIDMMMNDETKNVKQRELVVSWSMFLMTLFIILSTAILYLIELFFYNNK